MTLNFCFLGKKLGTIQSVINHEIKLLVRGWLQSNKLLLNENKTELIMFRSPWKHLLRELDIRINNCKLELHSHIKYLGMLSWNKQINSICTKSVEKVVYFRNYVSFRSSRSEVFCKKDVLKNFAKLTGKHLCQSLFFNNVVGLRSATLLKKRLSHRRFPVNFAKFLRATFLTTTFFTRPISGNKTTFFSLIVNKYICLN